MSKAVSSCRFDRAESFVSGHNLSQRSHGDLGWKKRTIRFMMDTKHQNVNSSSASVTMYTGAHRSDIPCTYPEFGPSVHSVVVKLQLT